MNSWHEIPSKKLLEALTSLLEATGEYAGPIIEQISDHENSGTLKVAAAMIHGLIKPTSGQINAKRIMGGANFYDVADVVRLLGYIPTREDLLRLEKIPFSDRRLLAYKHTRLLVPVFKIPIRSLIEDFGHKGSFDSSNNQNHTVFNSCLETSWQLVQFRYFQGSLGQPWNTQTESLTSGVMQLRGQIAAYTTLVHLLATGRSLYENLTMRLAESTGRNHQHTIELTKAGIKISERWNGDRNPKLGLATGVKPDLDH